MRVIELHGAAGRLKRGAQFELGGIGKKRASEHSGHVSALAFHHHTRGGTHHIFG